MVALILFFIFIRVCNTVRHFSHLSQCSLSNFCIAFSLSHAWTNLGTQTYTLSLGFQAHVVNPKGSREARDQSQTSEVGTSRSHVICAGSKGRGHPAYTLHLLPYPRETEREKNWPLNHDSQSIHVGDWDRRGGVNSRMGVWFFHWLVHVSECVC